ncbi:3'-5' RNA helicase YTHDC2-like isoform 2-T3 [Podargus strigoides]
MQAPSKPWSQADETTLRTIVTVLSTEEQCAGLQQPSGIGQRPRSMTFDELPLGSTWRPTNSRKSSSEAELSDDSSHAGKVLMKSKPPPLQQPKKYKEKNRVRSKRASDDRSDQSSVKSTDCSSHPSPCASPSSPVSAKGFARMASEIGCEKSQDWGSAGFGGAFKVEWVRKESIPFSSAHNLLNPWNDNKKVQISRDGQELEPQVGEQLLQLWDHTPVAGTNSTN